MKLTSRFAAELRTQALVLLLAILALLSHLGVADRLIDGLGRGRMASANHEFLARSGETGLERLIALSLIRDGLALVGSAEVGVSFVVQARVTLGEILESARGLYRRAWQVSALGVAVLFALQLALDAAADVSPRILALFFVLLAVYVATRKRLPGLARAAREVGAVVLGLTLAAHLLLPLTVYGMSLLSQRITAPIARQAHHQMVSEHQRLLRAFDDEDLKGRAESAIKQYRSTTQGLEQRVENLARNATRQAVAGVLDSIVFPVGIFMLLGLLARRLVRATDQEELIERLLVGFEARRADVVRKVEGLGAAVLCLLVVTGCDTDRRQAAPAAPATVDASAASGVDVSHYQGTVDWEELADSDVSFAFTKATGGTSYVDPEFEENWHGIRSQGLYRGAYHYFYASDDPGRQADHFVRTLTQGGHGPKDLPPALDVEELDGASGDDLVEGVLAWLEAVEQQLGKRPMIYSDLAFAREYLTDQRLGAYPLWIAEYDSEEEGVPSPWESTGWAFWQHGQSSDVAGIDGEVDLDVYNGSERELYLFGERQKTAGPEAAPPEESDG